MLTSPRSGRRHKAWGVSPRINRRKNSSPRSGRQPVAVNVAPTARAVARSAGSLFRTVRIPGVPPDKSGFTPGFTLSCAPRTEHLVSQLCDCPLMGLLKITAFRVPGVNAWLEKGNSITALPTLRAIQDHDSKLRKDERIAL